MRAMMARRRALIAAATAKTSRLPSAYQEVEYLESTGNSYINTGIDPRSYLSYECSFKFSVLPTGNYATVFGVYAEVGYDVYTRAQFNFINNGVLGWGSAYSRYTGQADTNEHIITAGNTGFYLDNSLIYTPTSTTFKSSGYPVYLFCTNGHGNVHAGSNITGLRIAYFKVFNNGVLAYNFVPCYRKSNSKPGMYDLVNNVFYTNAGTGEFTVGPNV